MNRLYPKGKRHFLRGEINLLGADIVAYLLDDGYVYNAADQWISEISGHILNDLDNVIYGITVTAGVVDADDMTAADITGLGTGQNVGSMIVAFRYFDGLAYDYASSPLIAYMDVDDDDVPLAFTTDGGPVVVQWSDLATKIFAI